MGDKQFRNENSGSARHQVKFRKAFWWTFIGLALLVVLIEIGYRVIKGTLKELEEVRIKKEVTKLLEDNNQIILRKALEKSLPQIEELKNKHLTEVRNYVDQKLDAYFQERVISSGNVERFLDELYSVKNDYAIVLRKAKEIAEKLLNCGSLIKEVKEKKIDPNNLIDHECFKDPDDVDKYIEELFHKTVLSPQDLSGYVNKEIIPYLENKYSEFKKEAIEVVRLHYAEEAKRILGEKYENPEKFQSVIEEYFRKSLEKTILEKIDSIGFALKEGGELWGATSIGALFAYKLSKKMTAKVAVKLAAKTGSKIAAGATGFLGGVVTCSGSGPPAIVCGVAGGIAGALASDYIINRIDEFFTRDDLRADVLDALNELKAEVGNSVLESYKKQIESFESALAEELSKEIKLKDLGK